MKKVKKKSVVPIYAGAVVWVVFSLLFPLYKLPYLLLTAGVSILAAFLASKIFKPRDVYVDEPQKPKAKPEKQPEPKPETGYGAEVDAIIAEGLTAQKEMGRLYASIKDPGIRQKINELMMISDKIVQDAKHDPADVPQIKKFLSYYLPTTIKLLNAYDRMDAQGIQGENISGTMSRIEDMLDTTIDAYKKQLDSLFANQALDIEADIKVMNTMLAREGLADNEPKPSDFINKSQEPAQASPFGAASPLSKLKDNDQR